VQPPDISLGTLLNDGQNAAFTYPWLFLFPAVFLILLVLAVNLVGDALRDALDPSAGKAQ
jgi:ABC-type dipeptide/oligopeptide/nickel transport system permease subunit